MMSDLRRRLMRPPSQLLPSLPPRGPVDRHRRRPDHQPRTHQGYFESKKAVELGQDKFVVYQSGQQGPVVVLLHGGGFSALTFALLAKTLCAKIQCRIVAIDLRGHGDTVTRDELDLSFATMSQDVSAVLHRLFDVDKDVFVVVGHSMGGALAAFMASKDEEEKSLLKVVGLCVIDVVEGTAVEALSGMHSYLRSRPSAFKSLSSAIEWSVRSGHVRNVESAKVSMPGQLKNVETGSCATMDVTIIDEKQLDNEQEKSSERTMSVDAIKEEDEESKGEEVSPEKKEVTVKRTGGYTWRVDLARTEPHWLSWFQGLSARFLSSSATKLLVLAGVDRLDSQLTVGQMQGKFQMHVLPQAGHAVHEDLPEDVADVLATFMVRHKFAVAKEQGFHRTFPAC